MAHNFKESIGEAQKDYDLGGTRFKFKEGDTKVRILDSSKEPIATHFIQEGGKTKPVVCVGAKNGCQYHGSGAPTDKNGNVKKPSVKYVMYLLDRDDNSIKRADVAYSIVKSLSSLQEKPDWAFEDLPMPYDIVITYDSKAAPNDMYKVTPSPKASVLSAETLAELKDLKKNHSLDDIVAKAKGAASAALEETPSLSEDEDEDEIKPEDIPF